MEEGARVSKSKVLLVGPFPPTKGGVTTFMLNLMGSALGQQFDFVPFTTSRPPKKDVLDNYGYAAMLRGGLGRVAAGAFITFGHVISFPFVLGAKRADIVQIQASDYQAFWESAVYVYLAKALGRPVVLRIGGAFDLFYAESSAKVRGLISAVLNKADWIIAQSEIARDFIADAGRTGPIIVVSNWSRDTSIREVERKATQMPLFLFIVGSDARRKGIEEVLDAARRLSEQGSPARFHLIACPDILQQQVRASGLPNIVGVEGFVDRDRVLEAMCAADALLLPSHGEGFPNTLVEAMGCGLPAVVTPVGGVPEIVSAGGAILVPVRDCAALAAAIDTLARDPVGRVSMGKAALENLRSRYVASIVLPPLAAVYLGLVAGT
jgi:glycosyltransferase involved in cell wall biosynthesis